MIAMLYQYKKNLDKAEDHFTKGQELVKKVVGEKNIDFAKYIINRGDYLFRKGPFSLLEEASKYIEQASGIFVS
jgi:hypothetical protein